MLVEIIHSAVLCYALFLLFLFLFIALALLGVRTFWTFNSLFLLMFIRQHSLVCCNSCRYTDTSSQCVANFSIHELSCSAKLFAIDFPKSTRQTQFIIICAHEFDMFKVSPAYYDYYFCLFSFGVSKNQSTKIEGQSNAVDRSTFARFESQSKLFCSWSMSILCFDRKLNESFELATISICNLSFACLMAKWKELRLRAFEIMHNKTRLFAIRKIENIGN